MVNSKKYQIADFAKSPKAKILMAIMVLAIIASATFVNMRKTITLKIDDREETFVTYKGTVKDVLETMSVEVGPKDKVQPSLEDRVSEGDTISIKRAVSVKLTVGNKQLEINTAENTISEMLAAEKEQLKSQGIEFNEGVDEISPSLDSQITKNLNIDLVKVEVKEELAKETIGFDVIVEEDSSLDSGIEEIIQEGVSGEKEVAYEVVYKNGKEVSRTLKSSRVVSEPVNKVVVQGTRKTIASRNGQLLDYKSVLYVEATAYSGGGITATGTTPVRDPNGISTISVDPRVIPLGSLVYVEGYGKAIAADTGGAIIGNIIDVYVNSNEEAIYNWGRRYDVPVYILAYPGEW